MCFFKNVVFYLQSMGSRCPTHQTFLNFKKNHLDFSGHMKPGIRTFHTDSKVIQRTGGEVVWCLTAERSWLRIHRRAFSVEFEYSFQLPPKVQWHENQSVNVCFWELKQSLATDIRLDKLIGPIWGRGTSGLQSNGGGGSWRRTAGNRSWASKAFFLPF